ncbi:hypothetical protein ASPACDRAFT_40793 [Aspergillus aculeatus ATCC 16872]|uniref:Uncharacterized protein n=1 Tax=Aspergillus aculeatus (strain ATCC 16872 / CBS 172.66 / WB 5094) TaxID=690307 RepID=A0A1L9X0U4_ASPA1|nr:uncharacterized protein ASPACDRAFT_40793 [Aspergillus aculeatus ATCC 16872]OJK01976.1 hypothetical protein ASPACDRAFT_40793 [Aspergillus aculeatus ATCC 16872]
MSLAQSVQDFGWTDSTASQISNDLGWAVSSMLLGQTAGVIFCGPFGDAPSLQCWLAVSCLAWDQG